MVSAVSGCLMARGPCMIHGLPLGLTMPGGEGASEAASAPSLDGWFYLSGERAAPAGSIEKIDSLIDRRFSHT